MSDHQGLSIVDLDLQANILRKATKAELKEIIVLAREELRDLGSTEREGVVAPHDFVFCRGCSMKEHTRFMEWVKTHWGEWVFLCRTCSEHYKYNATGGDV
jgi:hypothetical protein